MEQLISLFIFPAAAGYIILTKTSIYRVKAHAFSNARLFIESVLFGLGLLYLSYLFLAIIKGIFWQPTESLTFYENLMRLWDVFMWPLRNEIDAGGKPTNESAFTMLIALTYFSIDCILNKKECKRLKKKILQERDSYLGPVDRICALSMDRQVPVQISLKNRKVYVGLILGLPHINPSNKIQKFINIMPIQSYSRDSETLSASKKKINYSILLELIVLTKTDSSDNFRKSISKKAQNLINQVDPDVLENLDTGIVVDMDEIISISLWDKAIENSFNKT